MSTPMLWPWQSKNAKPHVHHFLGRHVSPQRSASAPVACRYEHFPSQASKKDIHVGGIDKRGFCKLPCYVPFEVRCGSTIRENHPLQYRRPLWDSQRTTRGDSDVPRIAISEDIPTLSNVGAPYDSTTGNIRRCLTRFWNRHTRRTSPSTC